MSNKPQNEKELLKTQNVFQELRDASSSFDELRRKIVAEKGEHEWSRLLQMANDGIDTNQVARNDGQARTGLNDEFVHP